jgi:hypothetical protein
MLEMLGALAQKTVRPMNTKACTESIIFSYPIAHHH